MARGFGHVFFPARIGVSRERCRAVGTEGRNKMNKRQLASKIWESANKMRSKIDANEYKDYILGFIFYKYLSDKELSWAKKKGMTEDEIKSRLSEENKDVVEFVQHEIGYFISYENLFSSWLEMGRDFDVSNVTDGLSAFSRLVADERKKVFENIFASLETGLSKLGESAGARTRAIRDLIKLIRDIPTDEKQDYDVLGFIYEYLISNFAANAGKKAGEFYTPHEVSLLMSEIVSNYLHDREESREKSREEIHIYDPTSGSGSLLINIGKCVASRGTEKNQIRYYAQELKENTYNLTRMNLIMRGILPSNIYARNGDTLERDWPIFDENDPEKTYKPLYVDAVVSNPPYSQQWDPTNKETDPRFSSYGTAPKSKADYAFLLHALYHVKPDGIMTIVLPHGVLFRGGEEGKIRKNLIEKCNIDAVIGLPPNIFFGTGIPTIIMVLRQKRANSDVLIVDASKGFAKIGKNNALRARDIKRIADCVRERSDSPGFSRAVSLEEIRRNDYNLNIPRYVDSSDAPERWDILASVRGGIPNVEIDDFSAFWREFPSLRSRLFAPCDGPESKSYSRLKVDDVENAIKTCEDIRRFADAHERAFSDFASMLDARLIKNVKTLNLSREKAEIGENIFRRIADTGTALTDKYAAYQIFDDRWTMIASDIETIQAEPDDIQCVKKVDPNMVLKKKGDAEQELQDGLEGRILPFDLVSATLLKPQRNALDELKTRLERISSEREEILESASTEDKDTDAESGFPDSVASSAPSEAANNAASGPDAARQAKLRRADDLAKEERTLKAQIRKATDALNAETKSTIEGLSDEGAERLLREKWIAPLASSILGLSKAVVSELTSGIKKLVAKYSVTLRDIDAEIDESASALSALIKDLDGDECDLAGLSELDSLLRGDEK